MASPLGAAAATGAAAGASLLVASAFAASVVAGAVVVLGAAGAGAFFSQPVRPVTALSSPSDRTVPAAHIIVDRARIMPLPFLHAPCHRDTPACSFFRWFLGLCTRLPTICQHNTRLHPQARNPNPANSGAFYSKVLDHSHLPMDSLLLPVTSARERVHTAQAKHGSGWVRKRQ